MPTERITLDLDATALYAARIAAETRDVPLSDWISKVLRERAIAEAMESHVVREAPPGWEEETLERIFGIDDK
ncbi:hypothetical protein [Actinoplanes aureus]|uniref:Uncharacterized protein n=1 Tax=Actinoplanes aureus TaxID=2792083 RepID=A0A931G632_9ACTN|nr:hypothetical protein [Actinoplanes aureus]MBG0566834.1 hypothetical protein [Actinoplanes aureus]